MDLGIVELEELDFVISCACEARNRYVNRSGFSAHQRVFGSSLRLPGSLLPDNPVDRVLAATDPTTDFARSNEIRAAAQQALFKASDQRALIRAFKGRSRTQGQAEFWEGDLVYVEKLPTHQGARLDGPGGAGLRER